MSDDHTVPITTAFSQVTQETPNTQTSVGQATKLSVQTTTAPPSLVPPKNRNRKKKKKIKDNRKERKKLRKKSKQLRKLKKAASGFMDNKIFNSTLTSSVAQSQYIGDGAGIMDHHEMTKNGTAKMEFEDFESILRETDRLIAERIDDSEHIGDLFTRTQYLQDTTTPSINDVIPSTPSVTSNSVADDAAADEDNVTSPTVTTSVISNTTLSVESTTVVSDNVAPNTTLVVTVTDTSIKPRVNITTLSPQEPKDKVHDHEIVASDSGLVVSEDGEISGTRPGEDHGMLEPHLDPHDPHLDPHLDPHDPHLDPHDPHLDPYPEEEEEEFVHDSMYRGRRRKKKRKWKIRCKIDYIGLPQGRICCLNTVRCFDHLPEILDEIEKYEQDHVGRRHICNHAKNSLTCMSNNLKKPECRRTAKAINDKFKPELESITSFYSPNCLADGNGTDGQGQGQGAKPMDTLQAGVIGAAAGVAFLLIILIVVCVCWTRSRKSRSTVQSNAAKEEESRKKASSRYKDLGLRRQKSEVYAEIDERSLEDIRNGSAGSRPLPSAPNETITEDKAGYLTPQHGGQQLPNQEQSGSNGGYAVLDVETGSRFNRMYSTLKDGQEPEVEGEYVSPEHDENSPKRKSGHINFIGAQIQKNDKKSDDQPYHMYFVLEKETDG